MLCLLILLMSNLCYARGRSEGVARESVDYALMSLAADAADDTVRITVYFRWDKDNIDPNYLTNAQTLHRIDSIMHLRSAGYIDTLRITAFASPEGAPGYNQRLSERRAMELKQYILKSYPWFAPSTVIAQGKGENWDGFRRFVVADPDLPMKAEVLSIIDNPRLTLAQREARLVALDGGRVYKSYLYPRYYPRLRNSASLLVTYDSSMPTDIDKPERETIAEPQPEPQSVQKSRQEIEFESEMTTKQEPKKPESLEILIEIEPDGTPKYPIALRTNLLYDAVGAANLGLEIPIRERFSVIADFAYSYWRSSKNLYALQTLEYGIEARYWFGVSEARKARNAEWRKPLRGWNVGVYGRYWQRYDVQWIDGWQGDRSWSAGVTAGYAFPISKNLSFEPSIGVGYFSTSEYRHYHRPQYDAQGKYHLMWQQTGSYAGLSLTKVRFSLIWLIEYKKRGGTR